MSVSCDLFKLCYSFIAENGAYNNNLKGREKFMPGNL